MTRLHGWGGYPFIEADVITPTTRSECQKPVQDNTLIARGMGRSYGDSANAPTVLQTTCLDHYIDFDQTIGLLTCEAGITIRDLLPLIVPQSWFVPVTPGTSYVTIGGAIASDVHGKNHHGAGTFGQHVRAITVLLGTGEVVSASRTERPDLFHATCGGMGLTGVILSATIQLVPILSSNIRQCTLKANCLEDACEQFEANAAATYSVAWIDCVARGNALGRSVLMLGEHADDGQLNFTVKNPVTMPIHSPAALLNHWSVSAFNALYYSKAKDQHCATIPLRPFFYPLDSIGQWNRLYGKPGFIQYQCVLPKADGVLNMRALLTKIAESGAGSFLAVLKQFGAQNENLLTFPMAGYTLALDFKLTDQIKKLAVELDAMLIAMGGRLYLSKDALMSEASFKAMYPRWQKFETVRAKYGAVGKFASAQSKRLGLL